MQSKTQVESVRLSLRFQERVGKRVEPASYTLSKRLVVSGVAISFILFTVIGIRSFEPPPFQAGFLKISLGISVVLLVFVVLASCFNSGTGLVRYRVAPAFTWVSQVPLPKSIAELGVALVVTALGTYSAWAVVSGLARSAGNIWDAAPRSAWVWGVVFLPLSVYMWRVTLLTFRANHGIRLAPNRVGLSHKHRDLLLRWDQIKNVTVATVNKGSERRKNILPCVRIEADGGRVFHVDATELGSDPNVVAAFACYYLDRPQERHLLVDPQAALRRFREAQAKQ